MKAAEDRVGNINGVIADLGVSSLQFDSPTRGFSFRFDAPLDMRMDAASGEESAADILATRSEVEIANIIYRFGEERFSRRIARRIIEMRNSGQPVTTTRQLTEIVERSVRRSRKEGIHPATRTFQALRIAVNHELDVIERFLKNATEVMVPDGLGSDHVSLVGRPNRQADIPETGRKMHVSTADPAMCMRSKKNSRDHDKKTDHRRRE